MIPHNQIKSMTLDNIPCGFPPFFHIELSSHSSLYSSTMPNGIEWITYYPRDLESLTIAI